MDHNTNLVSVVLLHGYPFDRSMWVEQIEFLNARGYRALAPDLLGQSEPVAINEADQTVTTMADMARHVAVLMDTLDLDHAVICGLSMGGYVAFEFMQLFPERVRALILAGSRAPADNEQERQGRLEQAQQMLTKGMGAIAAASLPKLLAPQTLKEKPTIVARLREMILNADPKVAAAAQRGMAARRDYSADLSGIDVPTLVIVGRDDPIRPLADARFMHQGIRKSQLEILENAAHMTNMEQPKVFNETVLKFVSQLRP
jgi:pimeloyl-ACP methyl ester carboxylesterase